MIDADDLDLVQNLPEPARGAFHLWLRVFRDSLIILQDGGFPGRVELSRSFLFDPQNDFFDFVAFGLGVSPDGLRERVRKVLKKSAARKEAGAG